MNSYTLPVSNNIKRLREADFALETRDRICLYDDACNIVLFYDESPVSKKILNIFKVVADTVAGPSFCSCNILLEKQVSQAFMEIASNKDHPFHWVTTRNFPSIIIYKKGYPVNFYDGPADVSILTNFSMNINNLQNFHYYNTDINTKLRNQMWSNYRTSRTFMIGGVPSAPIIPKSFELPAIPYSKVENIDE